MALLHPTFWPEERRGSERLVHDAARALADREHDVTVLTSHRRRRAVAAEEGFRVVRAYRPPTRPLHARGLEFQLSHAPGVMLALARERFDVAHAFYHVDAWAALGARRLRGMPVVLSFNGIPTESFLSARRLRQPILRRAVRGADEVVVLSEAAAGPFERHLGRRPRVLPGGVSLRDFDVHVARAPQPTIVCAAALNDERKRGGLLLEAFALLRRRVPEARLVLAGVPDTVRGEDRLELPPGAERVPAQDTAELARLYAGAWASVLPAVEEAFGLVLVESLAAGTPAVGARSGAVPEVLRGEEYGRLFEPDDPADLARAMEEALELGRDGGADAACRARAADYSWDSLGARYEDLYAELLERRA